MPGLELRTTDLTEVFRITRKLQVDVDIFNISFLKDKNQCECLDVGFYFFYAIGSTYNCLGVEQVGANLS